MKISLVIPVYNSSAILSELVSQVHTVMEEQRWAYEIIFICDQSPDNSWRVIKDIAAKYSQVHGLLLRMNAGQHNAIMAGLTLSTGQIIITMDDDLQHSPKDIPILIKKLNQGYDIVFARFKTRKHPKWKILGSRLNNWVASYLMDKPLDLYLSPYRVFKPSIRDEILKYKGPYVYIDGLILTVTRNIGSVVVEHYERYNGSSRYGFKKSLSLWLKMATSFSIMPLRLTSFIGLMVASLGFLLAILLIIQKFTFNMMPIGWSSLIITVLILGGIQLLALGMLGEYLGRVLLTINARPQYIIAEQISGKQTFNPKEKKY